MTKQEEKQLCKQFVENLRLNNKPQALDNLNKIIESKLQNRIQSKKEAILASKKI